jgi:hypothetical protein
VLKAEEKSANNILACALGSVMFSLDYSSCPVFNQKEKYPETLVSTILMGLRK